MSELDHCANSTVSDHFFSENGKDWHLLAGIQPYGHTVQYDDGVTHTYSTLERPFIYFNAAGQMTHLSLAADLITGDEGCKDRHDKHCNETEAKFGTKGCACSTCKYADHAGTVVVALDV
jgi:hypothetical protein